MAIEIKKMKPFTTFKNIINLGVNLAKHTCTIYKTLMKKLPNFWTKIDTYCVHGLEDST